MTDDQHTIRYPAPDPGGDRVDVETEILIGRLIDGEASVPDRARFEALAAREPRLWRELALRQQDMAALTAALEQELGAGGDVELPGSTSPRSMHVVHRGLAIVGWAAVVLLSVGWALYASQRPAAPPTAGLPVNVGEEPQSMESHFERYLEGEHVVGEMAPLLLQAEEMPDGTVMVRYIRRIEEMLRCASADEVAVDEHNVLKMDLSRYRN